MKTTSVEKARSFKKDLFLKIGFAYNESAFKD